MVYSIILISIIIISIFLKIRSSNLFVLAGLLIILHPILIAKEQIELTSQLSIVVFLLLLSALIIKILNKLLPYKIDDQDSFIGNLIKKYVTFETTDVKILNFSIKKKYLPFVLAIIFILLIWIADITTAIFGIIFFIFLVTKWDSRILAAFTLVCLSASFIVLIFNNNIIAEDFAKYAFYFLIFTVIFQIIEYRRKEST